MSNRGRPFLSRLFTRFEPKCNPLYDGIISFTGVEGLSVSILNIKNFVASAFNWCAASSRLMHERLKTYTRLERSESLGLSKDKFCVCLFISIYSNYFHLGQYYR